MLLYTYVMRIAIIGLGGVGGYIGAMLLKSGADVVGFARGKHLEAICKNGLDIVEDKASWHVDMTAKTLDEAEGYFDIVIFCVKSYDLKTSYEKISSHIDSKSILISFANGVSNADLLKSFGNSKVLEGCVYILSHIQEAGVIRKKGKVFAVVFGGKRESTQILQNIFDKAGLRTKTPEDIKTAIWKKYIFISAFATITSYYDKSIGYVYEHYKNEVKKLLLEIADVAHAKGIEIYDEVEKSLQTASMVPYDSSTSMHLDFSKGKKTEIESLSGYIVKEATVYGINTPVMQKMYDKLTNR